MSTLVVLEYVSLDGDVAGRVAELKARTGRELLVVGSGQLAQGLAEHGLVDEYRLLVHLIVVGSGKKLFRDGAEPTPMRLLEARVGTGGLVLLTYAVAFPRPRRTRSEG